MGKLEASKKPARGQEEASKRPARGQQEASKRLARSQQEAKKPARSPQGPARGQQEASKRPGRSPKWGGPHETPKPLKNSHFHEENSPFSRAFPKTDFLEKSSWGRLKPARSQQEARKRPARGQQEASSKPAGRQQDASKMPARGQQEASKRPGRGPKWGGPHETPKPLKNSHFHKENSPFSRAFPKTDFLEKSSWGSLKPARGQQEASKKPAASQQDASKKPARGQQEASKRPGRGPQWGEPTKHRNH